MEFYAALKMLTTDIWNLIGICKISLKDSLRAEILTILKFADLLAKLLGKVPQAMSITFYCFPNGHMDVCEPDLHRVVILVL